MQYLTAGGKLGYEELNPFVVPSVLASYLPEIGEATTFEPEMLHRDDCKASPVTLIDVVIDLKGVDIICLHHKYSTPFIRAIATPSTIRYERLADHEIISGTLKAIEIYDMLRYPTSASPLNFAPLKPDARKIEDRYTFDKLLTAKACRGVETFKLFVYTTKCPLRPKDKSVSYILDMRFENAEGAYIQELTLRRLKTYVMEQLIYSFSPSEEFALCVT